jgi:hypothetical protein
LGLGLLLTSTLGSSAFAVLPCPELLARLGPPTDTRARYIRAEWPYHRPKKIWFLTPESPLELSQLKSGRSYLWAVEADGTVRLAPEFQFGHNPQTALNERDRDKIQHRDLMAKDLTVPAIFDHANYEPSLEPARLGGEISLVEVNGQWKVQINTRSAYTPAKGIVFPRLREDGLDRTGPEVLEAARDYFQQVLTDGGKPLDADRFVLQPGAP